MGEVIVAADPVVQEANDLNGGLLERAHVSGHIPANVTGPYARPCGYTHRSAPRSPNTPSKPRG